MIVQYGIFLLQSFYVFFAHQFNDVEVMLLEVEAQGNEPFRVGLNPHRIATNDLRYIF